MPSESHPHSRNSITRVRLILHSPWHRCLAAVDKPANTFRLVSIRKGRSKKFTTPRSLDIRHEERREKRFWLTRILLYLFHLLEKWCSTIVKSQWIFHRIFLSFFSFSFFTLRKSSISLEKNREKVTRLRPKQLWILFDSSRILWLCNFIGRRARRLLGLGFMGLNGGREESLK